MSDDPETKTEEPTGRRLGDARSKGQVAQSREIGHTIMLAAMLVVILMIGPMMTRDLVVVLRRFLEQPHQMRLEDNSFHVLLVEMSMQLGMTLALPFLLLMIAAAAPNILQNGLLFTTHNLRPQLERLSPLKGLGRLFSLRNVVELIKGIVKISIVALVAFILVSPAFKLIDNFITEDLSMLLPALLSLTVKLLSSVILVLVALAGADYLYQRYEFMKQMRMSKQEVKDEYKQLEGDPTIKNKVRQIRQARAKARMMQAVPTATVVVTNPTHFAVALKYEQGMNAPLLVAKGVELLALRIIEEARRNFIPVVENPPLARTLYADVELDEEIPRDHYKAVAEVIGYVTRLKKNAIH
ncbi:MAG: flagellar biosynthesis protein FlhB [Alphaproteobacteria bacterium]|nr:flagellar biosynthesis protein FlhB [Alphaproteobacteria bacterium]